MVSMLDKFIGCVQAGACGDALGFQVEFSDMASIRARYGADGVRDLGNGLYSDDTQMAVAVMRGLLDARGSEPGPYVSQRFVEWSRSPENNRAPGGACLSGCAAMARGVPWYESGGPNAGGCGSVMRAHPYGLWCWRSLDAAKALAAGHSRMTHRAPLALAASAALAAGVWCRLHDLCAESTHLEMVRAAMAYDGRTAEMLVQAREDALDNVPAEQVLDRWRGWAGHEAIAAAAYCVWSSASLEEAVIKAANSPGDSDSLASIAGALYGAGVGTRAVPGRWEQRLENRTMLRDLAVALWEAAGAPP